MSMKRYAAGVFMLYMKTNVTCQACKLREAAYGKNDFTPQGALDNIGEGVYYLDHIDDQYRRTYKVKNNVANGVH